MNTTGKSKTNRTASPKGKTTATSKPNSPARRRNDRVAVPRFKAVRGKFGLRQAEMSRLLGISPRKLSKLESETKEPRPDTRRRLTEIERLHKALSEIIDSGDIAAWMSEPNDGFDGSTPLQVVERGEIDRLWQMIYAVRTGHPG